MGCLRGDALHWGPGFLTALPKQLKEKQLIQQGRYLAGTEQKQVQEKQGASESI